MEKKLQNIYLTYYSLLIARFKASSLSNFVNNVSKRIQRIKSKDTHDDKKCEICGIKFKYCDFFS